jgi:hypothetical protein
MTVDALCRFAVGFRQDTRVAQVIEGEIRAWRCRTWLPRNQLLHRTIVAGLTGGRLGPQRRARLRRTGMTRRAVGEQILMGWVIEQIFRVPRARHS